jgi:hypothetical protein
MAVMLAGIARVLLGQGGALDDVRSDVHAVPAADSCDSESSSRPKRRSYDDDTDSFSGEVVGLVVVGAGMAVAAPFWVPARLLDDSWSEVDRFEPFPYADGMGRMSAGVACDTRRAWGGRMRLEYADEFDAVDRVGGGLLLEHESRLGFDFEANWLRERLAGGGHDRLWLGDANLVFRFAQCEKMQWRSGLGANWMNDERRTDLGFNFTYGFDLFPVRPWVVSTEIDWGTLGTAGLFRFRTTGGLVVGRFEAYTGYEYLDIGRTQTNSLLGGVRLWF